MFNRVVFHWEQALDRALYALANPARRAIARCLTAGEQNLSTLAAPLTLSFPAAS